MLTNKEKRKFIQMKISNLDFHINSISEAIHMYPEETPGKPSRVETLASLQHKKQLMEQLLTDLA
jgi:hypothetical protein